MATRTARNTSKLPLLPCVCFGLGLVLLFINLAGTSLLPDANDNEGFVGGTRYAGLRRPSVERSYKPTAADRGTPQYEEYMAKKRQQRQDDWNAYERGGYDSKVGEGVGIWSALDPNALGLGPDPAPAPAPAPTPSPVQASSGYVGGGGDTGGNPFQFLIDLFQGTTTTTTTTPPPSPLESFMSMFR